MSLFDETPATEEAVAAVFAEMKNKLINGSAIVKVDSWSDYDGYLKSESWQKIKDAFNYEYDGFQNVCMVSGIRGYYIHHHHWTYPDDLHNDSPSNLILVCPQVHDWIHKNNSEVNKKAKQSANTRSSYLTTLIGMWNKATCEEFLTKGYKNGFDDAAAKITRESNVSEFKRGYEKGKAEVLASNKKEII